ncbi:MULTISPECIES: enoyl-CoA hydratase-related protein [unclassified Sphingomonas]|jgi:2-(1,2-epoxy-1,2-dihydrophenyl)acetyl-CoA isomerase|uniref:enoyl-CoA hydratase-related protein n=3 Tax=Sphingomonas TaxID=13687 RepID=UPI000834E9C7|nr:MULTISPECIES: enoyl-CoA hydratase-related protein [unclassified Sphingomonas]
MSEAMIRVERDGDVLVIALNRPDRLNAAPTAMFDQIRDALAGLDGARAVLIRGEGRAFCAGADVGGGALGSDDPEAATFAALTEHYNPTLAAIADLAVPVVSAVRGAAAGIGSSLALTADFCIASPTAYFLQAFVNIGLVPDGGATWLLPRIVGRARAMEMMMLGERVSAERALEWGLIHRVVTDERLDEEALALAQRLARGPTVALGLMRRAVWRALDTGHAEAMLAEAEAQRRARGSADSVEGGMAFLQKRPPEFKGR